MNYLLELGGGSSARRVFILYSLRTAEVSVARWGISPGEGSSSGDKGGHREGETRPAAGQLFDSWATVD